MKTWYALIGLMALPALVSGQSLGDAARKERERREGLKKTGTASRTVTASGNSAPAARFRCTFLTSTKQSGRPLACSNRSMRQRAPWLL